jgi:hypothetical protein
MNPASFLLLFMAALFNNPSAQIGVHGLVDNAILGEPYVDCGGNHMEVVCFPPSKFS